MLDSLCAPETFLSQGSEEHSGTHALQSVAWRQEQGSVPGTFHSHKPFVVESDNASQGSDEHSGTHALQTVAWQREQGSVSGTFGSHCLVVVEGDGHASRKIRNVNRPVQSGPFSCIAEQTTGKPSRLVTFNSEQNGTRTITRLVLQEEWEAEWIWPWDTESENKRQLSWASHWQRKHETGPRQPRDPSKPHESPFSGERESYRLLQSW